MEQTQNSLLQSLTQGYLTNESVLDECITLNDGVKEKWKRLLANIENLGAAEFKSRHQELLKLLKENGVTYNVYGDSDGLNRPWLLDPVPLVISASEWRGAERGMKQRAFVLNKVLGDMYGDRVLLKKGIIPPELIYSHPGFLRACDKIRLPGDYQLPLYAADISRGPDGRVWVIKDQAQAPSGMGYALENRGALSRVIPELFQQHQVARLGGFFNSLMQALIQLAPQGKDHPRIVLLTPGPRNETYFEHAYLASYLGITLVQGEDLIMRDSFVWIKTVEGLEKVDVILRRVDDTFCDPLELREDSQLGIPGLLQAVRKGNVSVANPLGSSVLENIGLMAFLHGAFKYFLNEDPIIPMIATWWCGQKKEMNHVIDNLDKLVIKTTERMSGFQTVMGSQLSRSEKDELIRKIKFEPFRYVGQEEVHFSTAPVFTKEKLEPRYTVLRTYLVGGKDEYEMMRGGLARCSPEKGSFLVSNQDGGISKDTWVESTVKNTKPSVLYQAPDMKRKAVLPSRTAENLFWVGRYTQRVIRTSRFLRIVLRHLTQKGYIHQGSDSESLLILLQTTTHLTYSYPGFVEEAEELLKNPLKEMHQLICNPDRAGSILFTLNNLLKAMYAARDRWTIDSWRIIDEIENVKRRIAALEPDGIRHVLTLLDLLTGGLLSFSEMTRQSMYRSDGRVMYRMGQLIEEIQVELVQYRSILSFQHEESTEFQLLESLLLSNQNLITYRSVYRTYLSAAPTVDLLFLNSQNPTSVLSQLEGVLKYARILAQKERGGDDNEISRLVFECYSSVRLMNIDALMETEKDSDYRKGFDEFCGTLQKQMAQVYTKLSATYFSHSTYQQQGSKEGFQFEI
ncbi:MAG: circularly permuted type 2 ATP-grasp protein [Cytophagales bacterium]|nr:circularly permuted type 2 ATP-grasp protein [Cytophagales bacterium]MCA6389323.1 circularly permuted type 2 ATP-grasp protein [Cytophagales bacterium]MCA6392899.1 circularly permuted type 2 ATP-grasp protein [Cytophagales bacterium]MCA6397785.1 circularly permuted type 2 ATP-grasp protein [Cytophagales bacterium]MCA6400971.1 circularly permuted type 2 ATP-grasp protein [Cytophagales bacterium]